MTLLLATSSGSMEFTKSTIYCFGALKVDGLVPSADRNKIKTFSIKLLFISSIFSVRPSRGNSKHIYVTTRNCRLLQDQVGLMLAITA